MKMKRQMPPKACHGVVRGGERITILNMNVRKKKRRGKRLPAQSSEILQKDVAKKHIADDLGPSGSRKRDVLQPVKKREQR